MGPAPTWLPETNRNICSRVLLQKCEFNSLKELINIEVMLFLIQIAKSSKISYFFLPICQLSWLPCKCCVTQNVRNSNVLIYDKMKMTLLKFLLQCSCSNTS